MISIKLVAHRGYQKLFPENTLLAHTEAIKAGARFIETDIQLSADAQPVLYHDRKLKRSSELKGAIHNHSLDELLHSPNHEPCRLGDTYQGQSITPLGDLVTLLQAHPQVQAFIEVKSCTINFHGIEKSYRRICEALSTVASQCTLISFHIPFMTYAKAAGWHSLGIALRRWKDLNKEEVTALAVDFIFVDINDLPKKGDFNDINGKLVVYEVDSPIVARSLQQRGVEYIETFAIGEMHHALVEAPNNSAAETL